LARPCGGPPPPPRGRRSAPLLEDICGAERYAVDSPATGGFPVPACLQEAAAMLHRTDTPSARRACCSPPARALSTRSSARELRPSCGICRGPQGSVHESSGVQTAATGPETAEVAANGGVGRGTAHQSRRAVVAAPPSIVHRLADLLRLAIRRMGTAHGPYCGICCPEPMPSRSSSVRKKSSCARAPRTGSAQGTVPGALPASEAMFGCFCDPPDAPICHPQRGHPANLAPESVPKALGSRRWSAVMTPRDAGQRADDVVASHRAADGAGPSIEAARTYAGGSSGGAVVRFRAFRSAKVLDRPKLWRNIWRSWYRSSDDLAHFRLGKIKHRREVILTSAARI
jgi:hypothetical protein